jgi:hypothetical protein
MDENLWDLTWEEALDLIERELSQAASGYPEWLDRVNETGGPGPESESADMSGEAGGPVDV